MIQKKVPKFQQKIILKINIIFLLEFMEWDSFSFKNIVLHILDTILVHCILHILGTILVHCLI